MKKIISVCLAVMLLFAVCGSAFAAAGQDAATTTDMTRFADWLAGQWYEKAMTWCVERGYFRGTDENKIEPNRNITRAEFIAVMNRYFEISDGAGEQIFDDVQPGDWFFNDVSLGYHAGITKGMSATVFAPNRNITREQAFTMFRRGIKTDLPVGEEFNPDTFSDAFLISDWALESVGQLISADVVQGYPDQSIRPQREITRAEVAELLYKTSGDLTSGSDTPDDKGSGSQGGSGGSGGGGGSVTPKEYSLKLKANDGEADLKAVIDNRVAVISAPSMDDVRKALGDDSGSGVAEIDARGVSKDADAIRITPELAKAILDAVSAHGTESSGIRVVTDDGVVTLRKSGTDKIAGQRADNDAISVSMRHIGLNGLSKEQDDALGSTNGKDAYEVSVMVGGKPAADLAPGDVTVTVPYTPGGGENPKDLFVVCLDKNNVPTRIPCTYGDGKISFSPTSGSATYVISHDAVERHSIKITSGGETVDSSAVVTGNTSVIESPSDADLARLLHPSGAIGTVAVDATGLPERVNTVAIEPELSQAIMDAANNQSSGLTDVEIIMGDGQVTIELPELKDIAKQYASGDALKVKIAHIGVDGLTKAQSDAAKSSDLRDAYEVTVTVGDKPIGDVPSGTITASVPFRIPAGMSADEFFLISIDENGRAEWLPFECVGENIVFSPKHGSATYVITADDGSWNNFKATVSTNGGASDVDIEVVDGIARTSTPSDNEIDKLFGTVTPVGEVLIDVSGKPRETNGVELPPKFSKVLADAAANPNSGMTGLTVVTDETVVKIDADGIKRAAQGLDYNKEITVVVDHIGLPGLSQFQNLVLGDAVKKDAYVVTILVGNEPVSDFEAKDVVITVPFDASDVTNLSKLHVAYFDRNGTVSAIPCSYADGKLTFSTPFASATYVIAENDAVMYLDPKNGDPVILRDILDGHIAAPTAPQKSGLVFGGWFTAEDDSGYKYDFVRDKAVKGMSLYARWYTPEAWALIQAMDAAAAGPEFHVETDLLALVGGNTAACEIHYGNNDAPATLCLYRTNADGSEGDLLGQLALEPNGDYTEITIPNMPVFGNYPVTIVITPSDGMSVRLSGMLYVSYQW